MEKLFEQELIGKMYLNLSDGERISTEVSVVEYSNKKVLAIKQRISNFNNIDTIIIDADQMDLFIDMLMSAEKQML